MEKFCTEVLTLLKNGVIAKLFDGIVSGNRASLSSAVTLVESKHARKKYMGQTILTRLLTENRLNDDTFRIDAVFLEVLEFLCWTNLEIFIEKLNKT